MALLSRIFQNRRHSRHVTYKWESADHSKGTWAEDLFRCKADQVMPINIPAKQSWSIAGNGRWSCPAFDKSQIRLVVYADHDLRGRSLLFDSTAVQRIDPPLNNVKKQSQFPKKCSHACKDKDSNAANLLPSYQYTRVGSDSKMLGEMMFGSVAMAYKGSTLKIHSIRSPSQLMVTNVFIPTVKSNQESNGDGECLDSLPGSLNNGSNDSRTPQKNIVNGNRSKANIAQSVPVDVPTPPKHVYSAEAEDSGFSASTVASSASSLISSFPSASPDASASSHNSSFNNSYNSMHRRWMRSQTTSLEHNLRKRASDEGQCEPVPASKRPPKIGIGIIFTLSEEKDSIAARHFQHFFFSHITLLERHMYKLKVATEKAFINKKTFVHIVVEALENFRESIYDLYTAPRLMEPVWLNMMCFATHRVTLCQKFLKEMMICVEKYDTKITKFFMSTLITAVLTRHLAWVPTVTPAGATPSRTYLDKHSAKWLDALARSHPYNPLWAQLGDLYGAIGYPLCQSRTVVIGKKQDVVNRILYVLSYFIRCSEMLENTHEKMVCDEEEEDDWQDRGDGFNTDSDMVPIPESQKSMLRDTEELAISSVGDVPQKGIIIGRTRHVNVGKTVTKDAACQHGSPVISMENSSLNERVKSYIQHCHSIRTSSSSCELPAGQCSGEHEAVGSPSVVNVVHVSSAAEEHMGHIEKESVNGMIASDITESKSLSATHETFKQYENPAVNIMERDASKSSIVNIHGLRKSSCAEERKSEDCQTKPCPQEIERLKMDSDECYQGVSEICSEKSPIDATISKDTEVNDCETEDSGLCQLSPTRVVESSRVENICFVGREAVAGMECLSDSPRDNFEILPKRAVNVSPSSKPSLTQEKEVGHDSGVFDFSIGENIKDSAELPSSTPPRTNARGCFGELSRGDHNENPNSCSVLTTMTTVPKEQIKMTKKLLYERSNSMFDEYFTESDDSDKDLPDISPEMSPVVGVDAKPNASVHDERSDSIFDEYMKVPCPDVSDFDTDKLTGISFKPPSYLRMFSNESSTSMFDEYFDDDEIPLGAERAQMSKDIAMVRDVEEDRQEHRTRPDVLLIGRVKQPSGTKSISRQSSNQSTLPPGRCRPVTPTELGRRRHVSAMSTASSMDTTEFFLNLKEVKLPRSKDQEDTGNLQKYERNFGRSLLAGYHDHYMSDFVLHGTSDNNFQSKLHNDLTMAMQNLVLDEPIAEAACIIADTDKWSVRLQTCQYSTSDRIKCSEMQASKMVCDIIESVHDLWKLKMSPEFCLMHLEDRLQEIYFKSKILTEYISSHKKIDLKDIASVLEFDLSDVPLLLAVAGTHTAHFTLGLVT